MTKDSALGPCDTHTNWVGEARFWENLILGEVYNLTIWTVENGEYPKFERWERMISYSKEAWIYSLEIFLFTENKNE